MSPVGLAVCECWLAALRYVLGGSGVVVVAQTVCTFARRRCWSGGGVVAACWLWSVGLLMEFVRGCVRLVIVRDSRAGCCWPAVSRARWLERPGLDRKLRSSVRGRVIPTVIVAAPHDSIKLSDSACRGLVEMLDAVRRVVWQSRPAACAGCCGLDSVRSRRVERPGSRQLVLLLSVVWLGCLAR